MAIVAAAGLFGCAGQTVGDTAAMPGVGGTTVPVGSMIACQSAVPGYEGVFDLSGNVSEWQDSCDGTGRSGVCLAQGGSFQYALCHDPEDGSPVPCVGGGCCSYIDLATRDLSFTAIPEGGASIGFRCCS
jgi:sulfatase modifying factor 1